MQILNRPKTKVYWSDDQKNDIVNDVYEKFMDDPTIPLLDVVKEHCNSLTNGNARNIVSLKGMPWFFKLFRHIHTHHLTDQHRTEQELIKLQSKAQIKPKTQEQILEDIPTNILIMELVNRGLKYQNDIKDKLDRASRRYQKI